MSNHENRRCSGAVNSIPCGWEVIMSAETIQGMLRTIEDECRFTGGLTGRYTLRQQIFDAMATVRREDFVPDELKPYAYDNNPLPIGNGQTISQPFIVALMTDLLAPGPDDLVLEVGTGSGYQAAILGQLAGEVVSVEILPEHAARAAKRLAAAGCTNVEVHCGDGSLGWPERAPFDQIMVTAAAARVPPALIEQLRPGGRLVIPIGPMFGSQELLLIDKDRAGVCASRSVLGVAFVPLTGASSLPAAAGA
jgi:protein-L-isoaspartate(D-aspartate) O-methyltransferase